VYTYDLAGNRLSKVRKDPLGNDLERTDYTYDIANPAAWGSQNNRLMYSRTYVPGSPEVTTEQRWYSYDVAGRVSYVVQARLQDLVPDPQGGPPVQWYLGTRVYYNTAGLVSSSDRVKWRLAADAEGELHVTDETLLAEAGYAYDGPRQRYRVRTGGTAQVNARHTTLDAAWGRPGMHFRRGPPHHPNLTDFRKRMATLLRDERENHGTSSNGDRSRLARNGLPSLLWPTA
jgi:hypothetical protein